MSEDDAPWGRQLRHSVLSTSRPSFDEIVGSDSLVVFDLSFTTE